MRKAGSGTGVLEPGWKMYVVTALFAAVICVTAPFSVPFGPVPLSLATFSVLLASYVLGPLYGTLAAGVYLLLGAAGVPVFSGFEGGIQKLTGPTGGYLAGYLALAFAAGLSEIPAGSRKPAVSFLVRMGGAAAGTAILYAFGTAWFTAVSGTDFRAALGLCVFPFIPGDLVKAAAAALAAPLLKRALQKAGFRPA